MPCAIVIMLLLLLLLLLFAAAELHNEYVPTLYIQRIYIYKYIMYDKNNGNNNNDDVDDMCLQIHVCTIIIF